MISPNRIKCFIELNPQSGLKWHEPIKDIDDEYSVYKSTDYICSCGKRNCEEENIDFLDAKSLLEVMMSRGLEDYTRFIKRCQEILAIYIDNWVLIPYWYILDHNQLFDLCEKWSIVPKGEIYGNHP
jgi:hypothetical protein